MCFHEENFSKDPFACLPKSWINKPEKRYGWTEVINLLRGKEEDMEDQVDIAYRSGTKDLPPPKFSPIIESEDARSVRTLARWGSRSSMRSHASSIDRRSHHQMDSASKGDMSGNQSGPVEAITKPIDEPVPPDLTDTWTILPEFTLPPEAIELDLLDCDAIPALIAGALRDTNVAEFLERLEVLAYTGTHLDLMCFSIFFSQEIFQTLAR